MAKIIPTSLVQSISGKTCQHDNTYFATNSQTGATYAVKRCNPYEGEATELQIQQHEAFKSKSVLASQWWKENKPAKEGDKGTAAYEALRKAYKAQHKCGNIYAYMRSLMNAEGTVTIGSTAYPVGAQPNQGGTSTDQGGVRD